MRRHAKFRADLSNRFGDMTILRFLGFGLPGPMILTFSPWQAVWYTQANNQGQMSVGSKDRAETNGRTDRRTDTTDNITFPANAVNNNDKPRMQYT